VKKIFWTCYRHTILHDTDTARSPKLRKKPLTPVKTLAQRERGKRVLVKINVTML
jgi:hypothetical protein